MGYDIIIIISYGNIMEYQWNHNIVILMIFITGIWNNYYNDITLCHYFIWDIPMIFMISMMHIISQKYPYDNPIISYMPSYLVPKLSNTYQIRRPDWFHIFGLRDVLQLRVGTPKGLKARVKEMFYGKDEAFSWLQLGENSVGFMFLQSFFEEKISNGVWTSQWFLLGYSPYLDKGVSLNMGYTWYTPQLDPVGYLDGRSWELRSVWFLMKTDCGSALLGLITVMTS